MQVLLDAVYSWFVECSRTDAEAMLTKAHRRGNILMRPSTSSRSSSKYVITMRSDTSGFVLIHTISAHLL